MSEKKKRKWSKKNAKASLKKTFYECKSCDYLTSNKSDYKRHILTTKHQKNRSVGNAVSNALKKNAKNAFSKIHFCVCGKRFKTRSGEWKHKKTCDFWKKYQEDLFPENVSNVSKKTQNVSKMDKNAENPLKFGNTKKRITNSSNHNGNNDNELKQLQLEKAKLEVQKLKKEIENLDNPSIASSLTNELVETIGKIAGNNNCNNTNNISINMYLNENCKNAMNLEDFVKQITVSLKDLDYSKQNGYAKGITNIFLRQLNDLSPTERPIHCSDKKRLKFYVKDDDKWETDKNNIKITNSIKNVGMEQVKKLSEWEKINPTFQEDGHLLSEWQETIINITAGVNSQEIQKNEEKIKKEIGKVVDIKPELIK